jgi:hypothetical protein
LGRRIRIYSQEDQIGRIRNIKEDQAKRSDQENQTGVSGGLG